MCTFYVSEQGGSQEQAEYMPRPDGIEKTDAWVLYVRRPEDDGGEMSSPEFDGVRLDSTSDICDPTFRRLPY